MDLLLISPERLDNPQFRSDMLPLFSQRVGLLVIDEAHCISDWGHDFRPDYRRLEEMLARLPDGVAVLCTTATANDRVVADVEEQLRTNLRTYRGPLGRASLRLEVVDLPGPGRPARLARDVAPAAARLGDRLHADQARRRAGRRLAERPRDRGRGLHAARSRASGGSRSRSGCCATTSRRWWPPARWAWATTSPTSASSCTTRRPGSVISYYQQVGRAGRGVDRAEVVLLRGAEDRRIQDFFIQQAFPPRELVDRVLERLDDGGATARDLMAEVNLGRGRIDALLKVLDVEGAVGARRVALVARGRAAHGSTTPSATRA